MAACDHFRIPEFAENCLHQMRKTDKKAHSLVYHSKRSTQDVRVKRRCQPLLRFVCLSFCTVIVSISNQVVCLLYSNEHSSDMKMILCVRPVHTLSRTYTESVSSARNMR